MFTNERQPLLIFSHDSSQWSYFSKVLPYLFEIILANRLSQLIKNILILTDSHAITNVVAPTANKKVICKLTAPHSKMAVLTATKWRLPVPSTPLGHLPPESPSSQPPAVQDKSRVRARDKNPLHKFKVKENKLERNQAKSLHRFLFPRIKESRGIDLSPKVEHKEGE